MFSLVTNLCSKRFNLVLRNGYKSEISLDKLYPNSKHNVLEKYEFKVILVIFLYLLNQFIHYLD
jgi:hypothetical protein